MNQVPQRVLAFFLCCFVACVSYVTAQESSLAEQDKEIAADLKLLQGRWELIHGDKGNGPTIRSVKTIEGDKETLRRYDLKTGELRSEQSVTFKLSKSGGVRVFTFFVQPGGHGMSFVYKVDKGNFWDIPGLLHGTDYRNYQEEPKIWHWKRLNEEN